MEAGFSHFSGSFNLSKYELLENIRFDEIGIIASGFILFSLARFLLTQTSTNVKLGIDGILYKINKKYKISRDGKEEKWCESLWYSIWHTTSLIISSIILFKEFDGFYYPAWGKLHFTNPSALWYHLSFI